MAHQLGLGAYGSDDEETRDSYQEDTDRAPPALLGSYTSAEPNALLQQGVDAAPEYPEPGAGVQEQDGSSSQPDTSGGEEGMTVNLAEEPTPPPEATAAGGAGAGGGAAAADVGSSEPAVGSGLAGLPPELAPPPGPCSEAVAARVRKIALTALEKQRSFIASLRSHRDYSNPDLLQQLVATYNLQEYGSALRPEVFDPSALPQEDYLDQLLAALDREQERRKAFRASAAPGAATIAFERGAGALGMLPSSTSNPNLQALTSAAAAAAAVAAAAAAGSRPPVGSLLPPHLREQVEKRVADLASASNRKRSKWDTTK